MVVEKSRQSNQLKTHLVLQLHRIKSDYPLAHMPYELLANRYQP